jgi:hypothetical protein
MEATETFLISVRRGAVKNLTKIAKFLRFVAVLLCAVTKLLQMGRQKRVQMDGNRRTALDHLGNRVID